METAPCPVLFVGRGIRDVFDEEEECEGECEGEGYKEAVDAKVSLVHEVRVEHDIEGDYKVGRRIHDPYNWQRAVNHSRRSKHKKWLCNCKKAGGPVGCFGGS